MHIKDTSWLKALLLALALGGVCTLGACVYDDDDNGDAEIEVDADDDEIEIDTDD